MSVVNGFGRFADVEAMLVDDVDAAGNGRAWRRVIPLAVQSDCQCQRRYSCNQFSRFASPGHVGSCREVPQEAMLSQRDRATRYAS